MTVNRFCATSLVFGLSGVGSVTYRLPLRYSPPVPRKRPVKPAKQPRLKRTPWLRAVGARFRELRGPKPQESFQAASQMAIRRLEKGEGIHLSVLEALCRELEIHPSAQFRSPLEPSAIQLDDDRSRTDTLSLPVAQRSPQGHLPPSRESDKTLPVIGAGSTRSRGQGGDDVWELDSKALQIGLMWKNGDLVELKEMVDKEIRRRQLEPEPTARRRLQRRR